jgi:hypothetical protein
VCPAVGELTEPRRMDVGVEAWLVG